MTLSPVLYLVAGILFGAVGTYMLVRTSLTLYRTQLNEASAQLSRYVAAASRNPLAAQVLAAPADWGPMAPGSNEDVATRWLFDDTGLLSAPDETTD